MDRLTKRDHDSLYYPHCFECCHGHPDADACLSCQFETTIIERLAAYEDTNLEPEDIKELCTDEVATVARAFIQIAKSGEFEYLQWLLIANREGRLVVLPPKANGAPLQ